jgi:hypothetical protein
VHAVDGFLIWPVGHGDAAALLLRSRGRPECIELPFPRRLRTADAKGEGAHEVSIT